MGGIGPSCVEFIMKAVGYAASLPIFEARALFEFELSCL